MWWINTLGIKVTHSNQITGIIVSMKIIHLEIALLWRTDIFSLFQIEETLQS